MKRLQSVLCISLGIAIQNQYKPTMQASKWCDLFLPIIGDFMKCKVHTECGELAVEIRTYIGLPWPVEILPSIDLEFDTKAGMM